MNEWLLFLIESFKKDTDKKKSIWRQFEKDANRCDIYINNYKLYNINKINNYISIYEIHVQYYILIILTQIVFVIPFFLLQNNLNSNYILSEISNIDIKRFNINKKIKYECIFKKNKINIQIHKYLRIFDYSNETDNTICIVQLFIEFNLFNNKYSIINFKFKSVY